MVEKTTEGSGMTDIDEWCIGSHTGGTPDLEQLELSGTFHEEESKDRSTSSHSCTWSIHLEPPEHP